MRPAIHFTEDQFKRAETDGIVIPRDIPLSSTVAKIRVNVLDDSPHSLGSVTVPAKRGADGRFGYVDRSARQS
jgi:hypothetical protein